MNQINEFYKLNPFNNNTTSRQNLNCPLLTTNENSNFARANKNFNTDNLDDDGLHKNNTSLNTNCNTIYDRYTAIFNSGSYNESSLHNISESDTITGNSGTKSFLTGSANSSSYGNSLEANSVSSFTEFESILYKNIDFCDEIIKILVIGDKMVGKSTLIRQIDLHNNLNLNDIKEYDTDYYPTLSMDIHKICINLNNRKIRVEMFDTNKKINMSPIFQSKKLI